jgi:hypothetical protein
VVARPGARTAKLTFRCTLRREGRVAGLDLSGVYVGRGARPLVWGGD